MLDIIGAEAEEIIRRLRVAHRASPVLDRARVQAALDDHFRQLRLSPLPVRWIQVGPAMSKSHRPAVSVAARSAAWLAAKSAAAWWTRFATRQERSARSEAKRALSKTLLWARQETGWWGPEWEWWGPEWNMEKAWRPESELPWWSSWLLDPALGEGWWRDRWRPKRPDWGEWAQRVMWQPATMAAEKAARRALWWPPIQAVELKPALDRIIAVWLPFVDAFEAGLWAFEVGISDVDAVPRPAVQTEGNRPHCATGPAFVWPSGRRHWFWHGVEVPQRVIERPETLTASEVLREPNAEVRRVMVERMGADRLMAMARPTVVHNDLDRFGQPRRLLRIRLEGDEPIVMVEVANATAEPDGSFRRYLLRVPPDTRTCAEGLAWTFMMEVRAYTPAVET